MREIGEADSEIERRGNSYRLYRRGRRLRGSSQSYYHPNFLHFLKIPRLPCNFINRYSLTKRFEELKFNSVS